MRSPVAPQALEGAERRSGRRPAPSGPRPPCSGPAAGRARGRRAAGGSPAACAAAGGQGVDVGLAVVEDRRALGRRPRARRAGPAGASPPSRRRPWRPGRSRPAPRAARDRSGQRQAVGEVPELGVQVEDAGRHRPAQGQVAAQLGAREVGDEQGVGAGGVGRLGSPELVPPAAGPGARCAAPGPPGRPAAGARPGRR